LSKKKKRTRGKKPKISGVLKLPFRRAQGSHGDQDRKLSEIILEMALQLLKKPDAVPSKPAVQVALILASAAWNRAVGDTVLRDQHRGVVGKIDWGRLTPWAELRSNDTDRLIAELAKHKRDQTEVLFLEGLPDIAESRPHSRINWE